MSIMSLFRSVHCLCLILFVSTFAVPVYSDDDMSNICKFAFTHDPSIASIQTNAGHNAIGTAVSCDGRFLFTWNSSEISIRDRNSLRIIKNFPFKGVSEIVPDVLDSEIIILRISPFVYDWEDNKIPPSIILKWTNGDILGHLGWTDQPRTLNTFAEGFIWMDDYGFVPLRNGDGFTGRGYRYFGQGTVDINENDSLMVISSMNPLVWDLKHGRIASFIPFTEWLIENDTTLNQEEIYFMLPKPKRWKWKANRALYNRNIFSARFVDDRTIRIGGPTPSLTDWDINGTFIKNARLPMKEGIIFDFSCNDGKTVAATSDGFFMIEGDSSYRLDDFCSDHSDLPNSRKAVANIVSEPFEDQYFITSLCTDAADPIVGIGSFKNGKMIGYLDDRQWKEIVDIKIEDNGKRALVTNGYSIGELCFNNNNELLLNKIDVPRYGYSTGDFLRAVEILPDGKYLVSTSNGRILVYESSKNSWSSTKQMHQHDLRSMALTHDKSKLITIDSGNTTVIWNANTLEPILSIKNFYPFGVLSFTPDGYYSYEAITEELGAIAHISKDNSTYSFDQFDLSRNRPDIIASRLDADKEYVDKLNKAWRKRITRNGFDPDKMLSGYHIPEIEIIDKSSIPIETDASMINLKVRIYDDDRKIERILISNNGIPVPSEKGIVVAGHRKRKSEIVEIPVYLKDGLNEISVQSVNDQGAKSYASEVSVVRKADDSKKKTLWLVALGVSEYSDPDYKLSYAAKDAADFADVFSSAVNTFSDVKTLTLTDKDFSVESVDKIGQFLSTASIDDAIILFYAGHGVLDDNLDYYMAPADMDFSVPSAKGIPLSRLTDILDGTKSLCRYVVIDACHSGYIDKEDYQVSASTDISDSSSIRFRNVGSVRHRSKEALEISSMASEIFEELTTAAGITYISSASGNEVAVESEIWGNGLFTNSLKEALEINVSTGNPKAMIGKNLTFDDVFNFAKQRVSEISEFRQNPRKVSNQKNDKLIIVESK